MKRGHTSEQNQTMSLETVLKIGSKLRSSNDNLKHFKQVTSLQSDSKNKDVFCFKISIKDNFTFDIDSLSEIPENEQGNLYYLKYKIGNDNTVKYIFGDIFFEKNTTISKEGKINSGIGGYYQLNNPNASRGRQNSSFKRAEEHAKEIYKALYHNNVLELFRNSFSENESLIEAILLYPKVVSDFLSSSTEEETLTSLLNSPDNLKDYAIKYVIKEQSPQTLKKIGIDASNLKSGDEDKLYSMLSGSVFLHFEFEDGKHWYEFEEEFNGIKRKILSEFTEDTSEGIVLKKLLYKGIGSGDKSSDIQFPGFTTESKHKVKYFDDESILDLFYAVDFTNKGKFIKGTDIKRIILPLGENLEAKHYLDFLNRNDESEIVVKSRKSVDPIFDFVDKISDEITSFDAIFCKKGSGVGTPDSDLIEISGIQKSSIRAIIQRVNEISEFITEEKKKYLKTEKSIKPFEIERAFQMILGTPQFDEKTRKVLMNVNPKYQSHLLKVIPSIYAGNYLGDDLLIPAFIQNVEYSVRNGDPQYIFLSYDLKFLLRIQNTNQNKLNHMVETLSYQIGLKLGKLAKPLKKKINSFEKRYVGLLTRQISTKDECIKFANDIHEMLIRHERTYGQLSAEMLNELANIDEKDYNKEKLAFGFFEGYFKYDVFDKKKDFFTRIEKLLSDYQGNESLEEELESLQDIVNNLKSN